MYSVWEIGVDAVLIIWLCIITYIYARQKSSLSKLFPKTENGDILRKFEEVIEQIENFRKREEFFAKVLKTQALESLNHIQRVQILRYNPYNDTGGEQSFSIVLLDGKSSGVLITSLHSRAGTRIYTKVIKSGKSDMDLSKEEKEVLKSAEE